jgi:hypothetical protein
LIFWPPNLSAVRFCSPKISRSMPSTRWYQEAITSRSRQLMTRWSSRSTAKRISRSFLNLAVTSISIRMASFCKPARIMVDAGRARPRCRRTTGQHGSQSSRQGRMKSTRTTSSSVQPASANAAAMLRKHCSACSTTPSAMVMAA